MSLNFNINELEKANNFDSNIFSKVIKLNYVERFMIIRGENLNKSETEICNELRLSANIIRRFFKDLNMTSPFRYIIKSRSHKPVRYLLDKSGQYIRDQYPCPMEG